EGGGGEPLAVPADGDSPDGTQVAPEGEDFLAGRHVPDLRCVVRAGREESPPISAEGDPPDATGVLMAADLARLAFDLQVPDLDGPVVAAGGEPPARGVEGHSPDRVGMALEGEGVPARVRVPDPHDPVITARGQPPPIRRERDAIGLTVNR